MASVTDHGAADDPRSGATSLADWATAVAAALDDDDTTVDSRIATSSAADQSYADGVAAAAQSAAEATAAGALAAHEADTTAVHGIADTSALVTTARQVVSGAGLTGGGTLAADRTLAVGAGTGITVNADDVAVNTSVIAPLASPALTGTPTAPTAAADTNTTQVATTAYVIGQASSTTPATDGTAAVGTSKKYARADHVHGTDTSRAPTANPTFTGTVTIPTPAAGSETTVAASTAWAAERAKVGNLLTANQASIETDTTGFTATNSTLARASGGERGTYCLEVTATAASAGAYLYGNASGGSMPVVAGTPYTFRVRVRAASITRVVYVKIFWWQSNGTSAASTASNTSAGKTLSTSWATEDITAVAPSNAAYASLMVYAASSASSEVYLVDAVGFWAGAGGDWAMPGVPITNLGRRVTHPNTDDVLVQNWDAGLGRWQTVRYDSGWRDITSSLINGWSQSGSGGALRIRRINREVQLAWESNGNSYLDASAATSNNFISQPPLGFRPGVTRNVGLTTNSSASAVYGLYNNTSTGIAISAATSSSVKTFMLPTQIYPTDDAIPTSLPGTLVSAAPA